MPPPLFTFQTGPLAARVFYRGELGQGQSLAYSTDDNRVLLVESDGTAYYAAVQLDEVINAAVELNLSAVLTHTATGWEGFRTRRIGDPPGQYGGELLFVPTGVADGERMVLAVAANQADLTTADASLPGWTRVLGHQPVTTPLDVELVLGVYTRICAGDQGSRIRALDFEAGVAVLRCYSNADLGSTAVEDKVEDGIADPQIRTPVSMSGRRLQFFAASGFGIPTMGVASGGSDPLGLGIRFNEDIIFPPDGQEEVPNPMFCALMTEELSDGGGALTFDPDPLDGNPHQAHFTAQVNGSDPLLSATALVKVEPFLRSSFLAIRSVTSPNGGASISGGSFAGL